MTESDRARSPSYSIILTDPLLEWSMLNQMELVSPSPDGQMEPGMANLALIWQLFAPLLGLG